MARDIVELLVRRANRFGRWPAIRFHALERSPDQTPGQAPVCDEQTLSWSDWLDEARCIMNALRSQGVRAGDRVAIFARNCPRWLVADLGILMAGGVSVPIGRSAPAAARARMLLELQPKVVFVGDLVDLERLRKNRAGLEKTTQIVLLHPPTEEIADDKRWGVPGRPARFCDLLIRGRAILDRGDGLRPEHSGRDPDAPATIIYTAGRSGPARGAVITHRNLMAKLHALREVVVLPRSATQLLVLPLAGIFGRLMAMAAVDQGATTYVLNQRRDFTEELFAARPHFIAGAPVLFDRFRDLILSKRDGAVGMPGRITLALTDRFTGGGAKRPSKLLVGLDRALAQRFFRTRVRHLLGGRIAHLVCGGGVLDESVEALFSFAGLPVLTGYGSVETVAVATANRPNRIGPASVGLPLHGVELRLSPKGEVLIRGEGIFAGYLRGGKPEGQEGADAPADLVIEPATDADGWYHTGDLGLIEDDFLFLTGRKDELITLSGGRTVAPALIEGALATSDRIAHAVLCGEGRPHVGVLIWRNVRADARLSDNNESGDLQRAIDRTNSNLERHEQIRAYCVVPGHLSVESGELSANGEPIRAVILRRHHDHIDAIYDRQE
jgi:long-chain acyl-CoA synthetase